MLQFRKDSYTRREDNWGKEIDASVDVLLHNGIISSFQ